MVENENLRVGDAERAHAVQQLESQAAAGRLTQPELAERTQQARTATRVADLDALFQDLPGGLAPLPQQNWASLPQAPSGVSDTAYPHQQLAAPVSTRAAPASAPLDRSDWRAQRREERRAIRADEHDAKRYSPFAFLIPAMWAFVACLAASGYGGGALFIGAIVITLIVTPLVVWDGRRRRDGQGSSTQQ